jgi:hypothetical protein
MVICCKIGVLNQCLVIQLTINCILKGLIIYFMFEAQINYMLSLKKFKVSEILQVITFYTICSLHCNVLSPCPKQKPS